jgi:hypothetical protein
VIDLTKVPPFADAAWANDPNPPCLWCAGTGHVYGDYVEGEICYCPDQPYHPDALCECGNTECLGPADAVIPVVEALAATLPQLESPMLKLIKERNEARRLAVSMVNAMSVGMLAQSVAMEKAFTDVCKAQRGWDKHSYEVEGAK